MENFSEANKWIINAKNHLRTAKKVLAVEEFTVTVHHSQLVVELSCKSVIAWFGEPPWIHDPSGELLKIVETQRSKIENIYGIEMIDRLKLLAKDTNEIAPWHIYSVYGKKEKDKWISAYEICDQGRAEWAIKLAERSIETATDFNNKWYNYE